MRPQPMIAVTDVEASSRWYQQLLGCQSAHGGPEYERLVFNGNLVMQLHNFEVEHHHGRIGDPDDRPYGNGVLLWFEVDDFDAALDRADQLQAELVLPRHRNPPSGEGGPNHWECWFRDPDGYTVVLASPDWTAGKAPRRRPRCRKRRAAGRFKHDARKPFDASKHHHPRSPLP
jgi:catechol 2,3-dioxygenase-like lactoylglutathione lyase family enzyme